MIEAAVIAVAGASLLGWGFVGYPLTISVLASLKRGRPVAAGIQTVSHKVSVIIAAYNAAQTISSRLQNIRNLKLPDGVTLEVLVGSDGSTDDTASVARSSAFSGVRVFDYPRRGRAATHNDLVAEAGGDILVFTDADTQFAETFLCEMIPEFNVAGVEGVVGRLMLRESTRPIGTAERWYWAYDTWIRRSESRLGIMSFGSGACMAMRRTAFRPVDPREDIDFASTMDAVFGGSVLQFAPKAVAYDTAPESPWSEYASRARMTARNLRGVMRRLNFRNIVRRPVVAFSIVSRRVIRWVSAPLVLLVGIAAVIATPRLWMIWGLAIGLGLVLVTTGWAYDRLGRPAPTIASLAYGFTVASTGMTVGVLWAISGHVPQTYNHQSRRR